MTPERWQQIKSLFFEALERPLAERAALLDKRCGDDTALRDELEALLAAADEAPSILDASPEQLASLVKEEPANDPADPYINQRIGAYRVIREIGHGGMGTVYLAERQDEAFKQYVAMKVIRRGLDTEDVIRRFQMERQILAALTHPNIARLLDGGTLADGVSYFVMEYIDGIPLTDYCDTRRLSIEERLLLFQRVCAAVHYAHQNLVVHRDLKPSNILVTPKGQVKLLDFGIAKLLNPTLSPGPVVMTQTAFRIMTPEYASPEQVRGEMVTTASDVYALGVLLYELLTGHRPYRLKSRVFEEMHRVICNEEPTRPSTVVGQTAEVQGKDGSTRTITPAAVSEARGIPAERLRRRLHGDLDNIVLMAMRKEPQRRYASAEQVAEDIRRHLEGAPVVARKPTLGYRAQKFVRRHRVGVVAACVAILSLLGGLGMALWQAQVARAERDRAEQALARSETATDFLLELFEASDPYKTVGDTLTSHELLERGVAQVGELEDEPLVQVQVLNMVGRVYEQMGQYEQAQPLLEQALAVRRAVLGPEHPDVAESLHRLAGLLGNTGDYEAAEPLAREAIALRRKLLGSEHLDVARSLNILATLLEQQGKYEEAELLYREALAMKRRLLGEDHESVTTSLNNLALLLHLAGDYEEAESLFRKVMALDRMQLAEEHPLVATDMHNLAWLLMDKGNYEDAEALFRASLAMWQKLLGEEHPRVANSLTGLGLLLQRQGRYDEAERLAHQALAINRKRRGEEHPFVASSLGQLGLVRYLQGDHAEAEPLLRKALAMRRASLGEHHPLTAGSMHDLALLLRDQGAYEEAERLLREALAMQRTLLRAKHPDVAKILHSLAVLLQRTGDYVAAEPRYQEALAILQQQFGDAHYDVFAVREALVDLYTAWGRPDDAAAYRALPAEPD